MTLENAVSEYEKNALEFLKQNGTIGISCDKLGLVDIGNGFTLTVSDASEIIEKAIDSLE